MIQLIKTPEILLFFILILVFPLLFSIAFHELAHGYVAYKFGDDTPKLTGRLTLNPFAHLDVAGTILLFIIGLGWAKPVLINPNNIKNPTKLMLVALAGPVSNFLLAFVFALLIVVVNKYFITSYSEIINMLLNTIVTINIALGMFNLIPIPPLDGSRIVTRILPGKLKLWYNKFEQYGMFIMMVLLFTVGFGAIFRLSEFVQHYLYSLLGIN